MQCWRGWQRNGLPLVLLRTADKGGGGCCLQAVLHPGNGLPEGLMVLSLAHGSVQAWFSRDALLLSGTRSLVENSRDGKKKGRFRALAFYCHFPLSYRRISVTLRVFTATKGPLRATSRLGARFSYSTSW